MYQQQASCRFGEGDEAKSCCNVLLQGLGTGTITDNGDRGKKGIYSPLILDRVYVV